METSNTQKPTRLLPLLLGSGLLACVALLAAGKFILLKPFEDLERQSIAKSAERIQEAIQHQSDHLSQLIAERTSIAEISPDYLKKNDIHFVLAFDTRGALPSKNAQPKISQAFKDFPAALKHTGIIETSAGLFFYTVKPIAAGTLVLGRAFDFNFIQELAQKLDLKLELESGDHPNLSPQMPFLSTQEAQQILTYFPFRPVNSTQVRALKLSSDRTLFKQGAITFWVTAGISLLVCLFAFMGIFVIYQNTVVTPLSQLTHNLKEVLNASTLSQRVNENLPGDLGTLAQTVNEVLVHNEFQAARVVNKSRMSTLTELAAGFAHDINNRLAVILARTEMMEESAHENTLTPEEAIATSKKIIQMSDRITGLVKGLRSFSRNPADESIGLNSLTQIMEQTLVLTSERMRSHEIEFEIAEVPEAKIHCRTSHLIQALINIINNAHDAVYKTPNAWIKIAFEQSDQNVIISITNSGEAIPLEARAKLGNPFYTTKDPDKNVGLGLMTTKEILAQYGGTIAFVESNGHTQFKIVLPNAASATMPTQRSA